MKRRWHVAIGLVLISGTAVPALAAENKGAPAPAAMESEGGAAPLKIVADKKYCIKEAINSRIPQTYCKTAKEWDQVGTILDVKE